MQGKGCTDIGNGFLDTVIEVWVGFLGVRFELGGGGGYTYVHNLTRKYTYICSFRKHTF